MFRAATTKDPNFAQALSLVACLTTNPAEEMTTLSRAQALQGRVTPGEKLLIQWLSGVRDSRYSQGIVAMNDLLSMYPEDRRLAFLAGRWLIQQQRYEHAQMLLENAVAQDPDYPPVLNELGYAYAFSGQFKKAISTMQRYVQLEPTQPSPDRPLSPEDFPDPGTVQAARSRTEVILSLVRREKPTLRQLLANLAGARGHFCVAGTAEQVADIIEDWFTDGAADGFNIMPPILPAMLDVFSAEVIPILQKRGLFRTAYEGKTLREHYGVSWPKSEFPDAAQQAAE